MLKKMLAHMFGSESRRRETGSARQTQADDLALAARDGLMALLRGGPRPVAPIDYEQVAYWMAAVSSAEYFMQKMGQARNLVDPHSLLLFAFEQRPVNGLLLEFGVYRGDTMRLLAQNCEQVVHGFDSFEGLPEDWTHFQKKGRFSLQGQLPAFAEKNIALHPGWFDQSLPAFLAAQRGNVSFLHVDCDLYSSTNTMLTLLADRLVSGSVIVFDEYLNYPNWQQHEFRAFQEFVARHGWQYEYLGFASARQSVAVRLTGPKAA